MTPKEQLTKDRRHILKDMTVEKAEKYPELYSNLFGQADAMYIFACTWDENKQLLI